MRRDGRGGGVKEFRIKKFIGKGDNNEVEM
jgi:hypothetical protein